MPTRTTDTQLFEGEYIKCAKMVIDEPCSWKAAQVVSFGTNYEFQMAIKASANTTITIQVGDSSETLDVTTDWQRYAISFPNVTIAESTSLYILFPIGTYWIYNMQLERAKTPSSWRPAPEDAEDYADQAAKQAVDDQTQLDIFNKLTNNGVVQGIYLLDGQLYINGEYIAANTISGNKINGGVISGTEINIGDGTFQVDADGQVNASNMNVTGGAFNIGNDVFKVDPDGKVTAANINITGGSVNITTNSETADSITLGYSRWRASIRPQSFIASYANNVTNKTQQIVVTSSSIDGVIDQSAAKRGFNISSPSSESASSSSGITLFDGLGNRRVIITLSGIEFYNSSGTRTCRYNPNGTITVP